MPKCAFIEYKTSFDGCTATPKHVITTNKYSNSNCDEHKGSAFNCGDEATMSCCPNPLGNWMRSAMSINKGRVVD